MNNIIEWINTTFDARDAIYLLLFFVIWFAAWKLFLGKFLDKHNCVISELGAAGSFGVMIMLLLLIVLFIASIQAVTQYGPKMIFAVSLFWGIAVIVPAIFIIRYFKKDK